MKRLLTIGILGVLLTACGENGTDFSFDEDSGSGTNTLYVDGHIEGKPGDSTHMEVEVSLDGAPLAGAEVRIDSDLGAITLQATAPGRYEAHQSGFASGYRLRVEMDGDSVEGALDSPEPHTVETPAAGSTYDTHSGDLIVTWSPTGADETKVESDKADLELTGDPGEAVIPLTTFQDDEDEIEVERTNRIHLAGGTGDSNLEISYKTETEIFVENPHDD